MPARTQPHSTIALGAESLRAVLESAGEAFVAIDVGGRVLMWNPAAQNLFGFSEPEATGRRLSELIIPERYRTAHEEGLRRYLETGEGRIVHRRIEIDGQHRDGHEVPVELAIAPVVLDGRTVFTAFLHDISERRQAESATNLLASIVDSSNDAIIARRTDGTITAWNSAAERLLGYAAAEMIGQPVAGVWDKEHLPLFTRMQARLEAGERVPPFETRAVRKDGASIDVSWSAFPLKDEQGHVIGVSAIVSDITERLEAEAAARLLASVVESSDSAILSRDLDGTVRSWNPSAERMLGYGAQEMIGHSIAPMWSEDRELFEGMQATLEAGERVGRFEARARRRDGVVIDVSVTASRLQDSEGRLLGVSVILRDITEAKQAERELHEARVRFERAFENAPIGMALVDPGGDWVAVNRALCQLVGRDERNLLATDFQSITHADDLEADLELVRRALAGEIQGFTMEKRYLRPDGSLVWADLSVSLVHDDEGEPLYFVSQIQDITQRKDSEEELVRYTERLNELALHDPLTGLRNYRDFHAMLDMELERSRRYDTEWSVVLFDIDHFRRISTDEGRSEGDRVLREVAHVIAEVGRSSDLVARIGSDEFALVLAGTTQEDAKRAAERVAAEVTKRMGDVSLSFGTASWPVDGESKELVLLRADMQLRTARPQPDAILDSFVRGKGLGADGDEMLGVHKTLGLVRKQLAMDLAYVAQLTESSHVMRAVDGDASSFGVAEGQVVPVRDTICKRMVDGEIRNAIPDTAAEPAVAALGVTEQAAVGSYLGVPLQLADGGVYGTLCALSHDPTPELSERHVELMRFLASLIAQQIESHAQEAGSRRSQAELAGIHALLSALVARDHYTGEHSKTVVEMATRVASGLGLAQDRVLEVEQVALLHDIGKVGIPDSILQKRGPLNDQEWELMRQHPAIGARVLSGTETLAHRASAVKAEHERFDGSGYPDGLRGEEIPLTSRITFACDAYHAMTSDRPYRAALGPDLAKAELRDGAGSQFDPDVVEALLQVLEGKGGTGAGAFDPAGGAGTASTICDVLDPLLGRQTPIWEPLTGPGSAAALGEVRAVCRRCGTHVSAVAGNTALSGSCGNCGAYELDLLEP